MVKGITVSDAQYDWLMRRGGYKRTPGEVLAGVILMLEKVEDDLRRYKRWVDASKLRGVEQEELKGGE